MECKIIEGQIWGMLFTFILIAVTLTVPQLRAKTVLVCSVGAMQGLTGAWMQWAKQCGLNSGQVEGWGSQQSDTWLPTLDNLMYLPLQFYARFCPDWYRI